MPYIARIDDKSFVYGESVGQVRRKLTQMFLDPTKYPIKEIKEVEELK